MHKTIRHVGAAILLLLGTALAAQTSSIVKDDLFAGTEKFAKGATDVTELTMDPQTLKMVDGKAATRAHRMVLNVVRTYSYDKPGMYNIADVEEFRNKLNTGDWHCSVHTRDTKHGESTDICNRSRTDNLVETAIITVEPKELTFIHTIKQAGSDSGGGMSFGSGMSVGGDISGLSGAFGPEFKVNMLVMQAELKAQMAAMKPELQAQMAEMMPRLRSMTMTPFRDFASPDFGEMQRRSDSDRQKLEQRRNEDGKKQSDKSPE